MKKIIVIFILACSSVCCFAQQLSHDLSVSERAYYLSQIWSEIKYNFVNTDQLDCNIDSLYHRSVPRIMAASSDYDFFREIQKFMARLNDGHTELVSSYSPRDLMDYFSANVMDFDKKLYITSVKIAPGFDTTWVGAEILQIDGIHTSQYMQDSIFPYISASTEQHKWMQGAYKLALDYKTKPFNAKIRKKNNEIVDISLPRNGETIRTPQDKSAGVGIKYADKVVDFQWTADSVGILTINRFHPDDKIKNGIKAYFPDLYKAKKLIIDIRRNGGGSTDVAWFVQSLFTPGNYLLNFGWETRVNNGVRKANSNWKEKYKNYYTNTATEYVAPDTIEIPDTLKRITCPIVILIGRYTFSAAEDFLVNIYETPDRPVIIGEPTGGSTGSPLVVPLPNNSYARICTRRICYPISGRKFVNEGVQPDILVKETIDDYLSGKDVVLEAGLDYLRKLK